MTGLYKVIGMYVLLYGGQRTQLKVCPEWDNFHV